MNFPGYVAVWRVDDFSHSFVFKCHEDVIRSLVFMPGTNTLFTGSFDRSIRVWDLDKIIWPKEDMKGKDE
jgi:ribosomal RNA-processing protein 9